MQALAFSLSAAKLAYERGQGTFGVALWHTRETSSIHTLPPVVKGEAIMSVINGCFLFCALDGSRSSSVTTSSQSTSSLVASACLLPATTGQIEAPGGDDRTQ